MKGRMYHEWESFDADSEETSSLEEVHTSDNPYCDDVTCWCHTDADYHEEVTHPDVTDEETTHAYSFFGLSFRGVQR